MRATNLLVLALAGVALAVLVMLPGASGQVVCGGRLTCQACTKTLDCEWCDHAEECIRTLSTCPALPDGSSDSRTLFKKDCPDNLSSKAGIIIGSVIGGVVLIGAIIAFVWIRRCQKDGTCPQHLCPDCDSCCSFDSCCNCCCDCNECCSDCCGFCFGDSCGSCCGSFWSCACLCSCLKACFSGSHRSQRRDAARRQQQQLDDREYRIGATISSPQPASKPQIVHHVTTVAPAAAAAMATESPEGAPADTPQNHLTEHLAFQPHSHGAAEAQPQQQSQSEQDASAAHAAEGVELALPVLQSNGQTGNFMASDFI